MEKRVKAAIKNQEFDVYYQPQYDYHTKKMCGAEALMRWHCPKNGTMLPSTFVPELEERGLIYDVDRVIWRRVCSDLRSWIDEGYEIPHLSVNVSGRDLYGDDFSEYLLSLIQEYHLSPKMLHLEITETMCVRDMDFLKKTVQSLQEKGFVVEMDDFGSGYSSLKNLQNVPYDIIKLDMDFLQESEMNEKAKSILTCVVDMMQKLNLSIIVEGVETESQAELLNRLGCRHMQGFYFGKPEKKEVFEERLSKEREMNRSGR